MEDEGDAEEDCQGKEREQLVRLSQRKKNISKTEKSRIHNIKITCITTSSLTGTVKPMYTDMKPLTRF